MTPIPFTGWVVSAGGESAVASPEDKSVSTGPDLEERRAVSSGSDCSFLEATSSPAVGLPESSSDSVVESLVGGLAFGPVEPGLETSNDATSVLDDFGVISVAGY